MKMIFHRGICACVLILSRSNSFRPQNGSFQIKLFKINHVFGEINMNTEYIYLKSIRSVCLDIQTDIQYYVEFYDVRGNYY